MAEPLPQGDVVVAIRPEDMRLAAATAPGSLIAQVTRLTLQGGHVLVGLEAPGPLEALVPAGGSKPPVSGWAGRCPSPCGRPTCTCCRPPSRVRPPKGDRRPILSQETGQDAKGYPYKRDRALRRL